MDPVVFVFDDAGSLTHRYLHGPGVDQILADEQGPGQVYWALADQEGTVRDIVLRDGETGEVHVVEHRTYDTFGTSVAATNPSGSPLSPLDATTNVSTFLYSYTGREWDADARFYYFRHRWLDPVLGKFVTEAPLGFAAGDVNLTRYVGNGPTNATDPSGLEEEDADPQRWRPLTSTWVDKYTVGTGGSRQVRVRQVFNSFGFWKNDWVDVGTYDPASDTVTRRVSGRGVVSKPYAEVVSQFDTAFNGLDNPLPNDASAAWDDWFIPVLGLGTDKQIDRNIGAQGLTNGQMMAASSGNGATQLQQASLAGPLVTAMLVHVGRQNAVPLLTSALGRYASMTVGEAATWTVDRIKNGGTKSRAVVTMTRHSDDAFELTLADERSKTVFYKQTMSAATVAKELSSVAASEANLPFGKTWSSMVKSERRAFKHAYSRHGSEFGLPNWMETRAEPLRGAFNDAAVNVRDNATRVRNDRLPVGVKGSGKAAAWQDVRVFEHTDSSGRIYYYTETLGGSFISAGIVR